MSKHNISHEDMVLELFKNPAEIQMTIGQQHTPIGQAEALIKIDLLHGAMGASGEVGELVDAIKKHVFYNKPLDKENVVEELGDAIFYLQSIMNTINISKEDVIEHNMDKLNKRYPGFKYSDKKAQERADKQ